MLEKIKADKLLFTGDWHLNSSTPKSRIDDYADTTLKKLKQIKDICVENDIKVVIQSGDLFHKNRQPLSYVNRVLEVLKGFRDEGIQIYAIAGNHDLAYGKLRYLNKSPLGNVFMSELVKPLDELSIKTSEGYEVKVNGFHYPDEIESAEDSDISICVAHRFYNYKFEKKSLRKEDIKELGYNIYLLGHDHINHKPKQVEGSVILRPGSVLRGSSYTYNLERDVWCEIIKFNGEENKPKLSFGRKKLDIYPAEQIFTSAVFHKQDEEEEEFNSISELTENIDELLNQMENVKSQNPVYTVLDEMRIEEEVKERIELYLNNFGIYRG